MVPGMPTTEMPNLDRSCAPRNVPSPPMATRPSSPSSLQVLAAFCWPSLVRNSSHRALYRIVPPRLMMRLTLELSISIKSPAMSPA